MHGSAPKRILDNREWASVTLKKTPQMIQRETWVSELCVLIFQELRFTKHSNTFIYKAMASSKNTIKLGIIQDLLREVSVDLRFRLGSFQLSNYSSHLVGCIHIGLNWEDCEILWPAGPGQKLFGFSSLREVCLWFCLLTWCSWMAILQNHIYIYLALHALSFIMPWIPFSPRQCIMEKNHWYPRKKN